MTQQHVSHPEGLANCSAGHRARHIHDLRGVDRGGGHLVECCCRHTSKHAEPGAALAEWKKINRAPRAARKVLPVIAAPADNVVQLGLSLVGGPARQRAAGGGHGGR